MAVSFETPPAEGGQAPVTVACEPPSGSTFPIGSTEVRCTATDALNRSASCVFPVSVARTPILSKTRFLAFGDSVTVGITSTENPAAPPPYLLTPVPDDAYPAVLQRLLAARYTTQSITVLNEGKGGERAQDALGRASVSFNGHRPEVVVIMMGYNDLAVGDAGIEDGIRGINDLVKEARFRGASRVFLATLTPPPIGVNRGIGGSTIARFNERLRDVARGENAVLVDVHQAWLPNPNRYNSADGRHPNAAGYRLIAETIFAALRADLETP
jgi:acyl-CoA thioesterase-1